MTDAALTVSGLTVDFGGLRAVDDVSLTIRKGRVTGLIGPNGAGKTTFFNAVTGLVPASHGQITFYGANITALSAPQRAAAGIRRTFQSVQLIPDLTVLENVLVGLHGRWSGGRWADALNPFGGRRVEEAAQVDALAILDFLGIRRLALSPIQELSFAQQRLVEIARAIVARPGVLMLDEPAAGLSGLEIEALDRLLRRLCTEWGTGILLVEHVLSLVMGVSDEITVLDNGRMIAQGLPREVEADPRVRTAYLGE